jgi:hypothetical protein
MTRNDIPLNLERRRLVQNRRHLLVPHNALLGGSDRRLHHAGRLRRPQTVSRQLVPRLDHDDQLDYDDRLDYDDHDRNHHHDVDDDADHDGTHYDDDADHDDFQHDYHRHDDHFPDNDYDLVGSKPVRFVVLVVERLEYADSGESADSSG